MENYTENLAKAATAIEEADYIVVGGAAGMSLAAGKAAPNFYALRDEKYLKYFGAFEEKYHAGSLWNLYYLDYYGSKQWESSGDRWGFLISLGHLMLNEPIYKPYADLKNILQGKDFGIVTTNQDTQFRRAFPDKDVAIIQGDWGYLQCSERCHDKVYNSEEIIAELYPKISGCHLPEELIPRCEYCGAELHEWVRGPEFLEGTFYRQQYDKYQHFIKKAQDKKVVYLELGVGRMTPMFIKEPFINLTYENPKATYITINPKDAITVPEIQAQSVVLKEDIAKVLENLKQVVK